MSEMIKSVLQRFARAFVAGGIANMAGLVIASHNIATVKDLEAWVYSLLVAFISGGVLALDKLLRYKE